MAARLVRALLAAALCTGYGCHAILGPGAIDENWRVVDSPHFAFYVRPGSFGEKNIARVIETLEDQHAFAVSLFGIRYAGRISVFLFESRSDAGVDLSTAHADTESVSVLFSSEENFITVMHETNHVILLNGLGPAATYFMVEGMASAVMSERYYPYGKSFLYPWTAQNDAQVPPLADLVDDGRWSHFPQRIAYNASASFLAYMLDVGGPDRLKQLLPAPSSEFAGRFQQIYGKSLDEAEREWRTFCASFR
jgi:hypothetical protein